jgi:diguanylate cyclase (GGDEF)-like protein
MYGLIASVFVLSIIVFAEFYLGELGAMVRLRVILMAIRYSATPLIIAMTLYTLAKKDRLFIFVPAIICTFINIVSIFNGCVFALTDDGTLVRGAFGYLPYIAVGLYCFLLVLILVKEGNKQAGEIIPIMYLCFAFASGLVLPFFLGRDYFRLFCTNIAIALFVYYDFSILHLTKKDPLTGLLNRQAYESVISDKKDISAIVSIDMNGLKEINDTQGHTAGDEALKSLALCFMKATRLKQIAYRIGGDEFLIICWKSSESEVQQLIERIEDNVAKTQHHCAVGYSFSSDGTKTVSEMLREADDMMYAEKEKYYLTSGQHKYR